MIDRAAKLGGAFALHLFMGALTVPAQADAWVPIDQGWTQADLTQWYEMSAGSRLIPLSWLLALEQPDNDAKFLDDAHIAKFRYLPHVNSDGLPLPLGFAVDTQSDKNLKATRLRWKASQGDMEPWAGMNCSACHTAELTFKGNRIRVQGAPTLADFQSFMTSLDRALTATRDDPDKWNRFAARVLADGDTQEDRARLKDALEQFTARRLRIEDANAAPLRYGYGRLDAFGHIFNDIALSVGVSNPKPIPSDAPVSYPFLWNVPQHDKVQWDGIAPNTPFTINGVTIDPGALVRNSAGMLGVFTDVNVTSSPLIFGYNSSLLAANIVAFEDKLRSLLPPRWPSDQFGTPDPALVEKGAQLFAAQCARCHDPLPHTDLQTHFKVKMIPFAGAGENVGTDPGMACNVYATQAASGSLKGALKVLVFDPIGDTAPARDLVNIVTLGALVKDRRDLVDHYLDAIFHVKLPVLSLPGVGVPMAGQAGNAASGGSCKDNCEAGTRGQPAMQQRLSECMTAKDDLLAYKARPLTGIWATAPYLHDGSVPTLYDLLLPAAQRPKTFFTGTREFDPVRIGYLTTPSADNDFLFETQAASGDAKPGNSNSGHEFGTTLNEDQRKALIEYLKTL
jgi:cytochrome c553